MDKTDVRYASYVATLEEELIAAMGCTEPIAIALAAARARDLVGGVPDRMELEVSGSIVKNAKSVVVPHTGGLKGIEAAAAAGAVAGRADEWLEVIAHVTDDQIRAINDYLATAPIVVERAQSDLDFDLTVTAYRRAGRDGRDGRVAAGAAGAAAGSEGVAAGAKGDAPDPKGDAAGSETGSEGVHSASVRIAEYHTNIVCEQQDGVVLREVPLAEDGATAGDLTDRSLLSMEGIWDFANTVDIDDVRNVIGRQIDCNWAIAQEGMANEWGANIGKVLVSSWGDDVKTRACALAAAGSDARMSGCELPVVINSGSGNQGITASVPVIEYAHRLGASEDQLYRALVLSNLVAIHQKTGIGRLSAFCGAVCAGAAAGAGIAYLNGGGYDEVVHTVVNALSVVSGIVCDGAKPSCAAKIAMSVNAGILGFEMYRAGQQFYDGEGIVKKGVENTIDSVCRVGREGMRATNDEIISIMLGS